MAEVRKRNKRSYGRNERQRYGVIATLVNVETGETRVEHEGGCSTREGTRAVAAICDRLGPEWKVRTLSHPLTILSDLLNYGRERVMWTESAMLGGIGRNDLIEHKPARKGLDTRSLRRRRRRG